MTTEQAQQELAVLKQKEKDAWDAYSQKKEALELEIEPMESAWLDTHRRMTKLQVFLEVE